MSPELEKSYIDEVSSQLIRRLLSRSLVLFIALEVVMALVSVGLSISLVFSCSPIKGITLDGAVFETYSFSCPNPNVEPIY